MIPAEAVEAESPMTQFQDALGDYYDAGMIGTAPKLEDFKNGAAS